jgi:hypothetical protein
VYVDGVTKGVPNVPGVLVGGRSGSGKAAGDSLLHSSEVMTDTSSFGGFARVQDCFVMEFRWCRTAASDRWKERERKSAIVLVSPGM